MARAGHEMPQRDCDECGGSYEPYLTTQRWCSGECRTKGKNRRVAERRKAGTLGKRTPSILAPCRRCGGVKEHEVRKRALCLTCRRQSDSDTRGKREQRAYMNAMKNDPCAYCGEPAVALDHIDPYSEGGVDEWSNRAGICKSCNSAKFHSSLLAFMLYERHVEDMLPILRQGERLGRTFGLSRRWLDTTLTRKGA